MLMASCCSFVRRRWPQPSQTSKYIRVVHLNGYIQDYDPPVTAGQITGKPPKHILCSASQLIIIGSPAIRSDDRLEPGRVYFLLPPSIFQANSSPLDMMSLVNRLTEVARKTGPMPAEMVGSVRLEPVQPDRIEEGECGRKRCDGGWRPKLETIEERPSPSLPFRSG